MSKYVLIHMTMEHCGDQSGLLLTIDTERISDHDYPLTQGKQITFKNPKLEGYSVGWLVLVYSDDQNQLIKSLISSSERCVFT